MRRAYLVVMVLSVVSDVDAVQRRSSVGTIQQCMDIVSTDRRSDREKMSIDM